jgi:hypothetical protein
LRTLHFFWGQQDVQPVAEAGGGPSAGRVGCTHTTPMGLHNNGTGSRFEMNSQTKTVSLAVLIGLAFSLVTALSTWEFDRYDIFNPGFLGSWVGQHGVVPFIFVFITIVVTFRKQGILISTLNFVGAIL